jgi:hypothetical protein
MLHGYMLYMYMIGNYSIYFFLINVGENLRQLKTRGVEIHE